MGEQFQLDTPEAISVSYDIAGIGTRFLAAVVDSLAIVGLGVVILSGVVAIASLGALGQTLAIILAIILYFILLFGYFVVYETLWSGQTPGKRAYHIRVIKTSGYPISFVDAFIRNLVRIVDFLPTGYSVGIVAMFISTQSRRLGDYAAGTLVVKERSDIFFSPAAPASAAPDGDRSDPGSVDPEELEWNLRSLSPADLVLAREYLARSPALPRDAQERIGREIAGKLADRIGAREPLDAELFLSRILFLLDDPSTRIP